MIEEIRLQNFKSHADTRIKLGRLTVLVGPNAAGKSSVLQAMQLFSQSQLHQPGTAFRHTTAPAHLLRRGGKSFSIECLSGGSTYALDWQQAQESPHPEWRDQAPDSNVGWAFWAELSPARLAEPSPLVPNLRLTSDGAGLASIIAELKLRESAQLKLIVEDLGKIVPNLEGIRVHTVERYRKDGRSDGRMELLFDFKNAQGIPAHAVSHGTLVALGLLTVLYVGGPNLLLIDDLDHALHPIAQCSLIKILRAVLEGRPDLQIMATTHSPYLVDELQPEEVLVTAVDSQGISHCRSLAEHPRAERLMDVFTTGEFLSSQGEDWVLPDNA